MKLIVLMVLLPLTMAVTSKQCRNACKSDYGSNVGGRVATVHDNGPYGFNYEADCTCIFPWQSSTNQNECDNICASRNDLSNYCHSLNRMCILHVALVY